MTNPDLSPAVVRDEEPMCTCGMMMAGGEPCAAHFPVSVPEERQGYEEYVETVSDFLNRIAYQVAPLTIAAGDKLIALAGSLDALAVAVKKADENSATAHSEQLKYIDLPRWNELRAAITSLLDGRTMTPGANESQVSGPPTFEG